MLILSLGEQRNTCIGFSKIRYVFYSAVTEKKHGIRIQVLLVKNWAYFRDYHFNAPKKFVFGHFQESEQGKKWTNCHNISQLATMTSMNTCRVMLE